MRDAFFFFSILQATGRRGRGEGGGARSSFSQLSISAVLIGGVGVVGGAVGLLAVLTRRHPLVDPVQAARLLEVADLPRGGEALDGCRTQSRHQGAASARRKGSSLQRTGVTNSGPVCQVWLVRQHNINTGNTTSPLATQHHYWSCWPAASIQHTVLQLPECSALSGQVH